MIKLLALILYRSKKLATSWHLQTVMLFVCLFFYSAAGYMYFELPVKPDLSWNDAFWWSLVTMTTVGYGDFFPTTFYGRLLVGFPTMILGVGLLGYFLSIIASIMIESNIREVRGMKNISLQNHIIVCYFVTLAKTTKLILELRRGTSEEYTPIVVVDEAIDELPPELREMEGVFFVKGDPSSEYALRKANLSEAKSLIVQADVSRPQESDNRAIKTILTAETFAPDIISVAECMNPENEPFLLRAHCDSVVCIATLAEQMLVQELQDPGISQVVADLTTNHYTEQFFLIPAPSENITYGEVRESINAQKCLTIGIHRGGQNHLMPPDDFQVQPADKVIVIASRRP